MFSTYGKSIVAALYAVAVVAVPLFDGGRKPTPAEGVQIVIAIATAISVYIAPLIPSATWIKTAVGATLAGLQVLVTVIDGGVNGNDMLMIAFAVASFLGITIAPAVSPKTGARAGLGA